MIRRFVGSPKVYLVGLGFLALEAITAIIEPFPIAYLIDFLRGSGTGLDSLGLPRLFTSERTQTLFMLTLAIILIAAFNKAADSLAEVCMARGGRVLGYNVRVAMYSHLQRLSLAYHDRKRTGDVLTRVTGDVLVVEEFVVSSVANIVASLLVLVGTFVVLLFHSWQVALVAVVVVPVISTVSNQFSKRIKAASKSQRASEGDLASTAQEMLTTVRLVQSYGRGSVDHARFSQQTERSMWASLRTATIQAQFSFAIAVLEALAISAVVWVGVWLVDRDAISIGTLVLFILMLQNMFKPARKIVSEWYKIGKVMASVERIDELLRREPAVVDLPGAVRAPRLTGRLSFRHVRFTYPAENEDGSSAEGAGPVLRDVNFAVAPGEVVALVGASGAGKSTVAQLVPRLYDPDEGAVLVDDMDLRSLTLESLRGQVSLVLQDTVLLTGTVGENIAYGVARATQDSIVAAARAANAHDFIEALPQGYDTVLGERGATVSGGQRQRIAIARAFIRETPILILDEPTTGLDTESTRLVVEALRTLMRGRTTIIISHDESLIRSADRVLVIDEGRIAGTGPGELSGEPDVDAERHMHTKQPVEVRVNGAVPVVVADAPTTVPSSVQVVGVPAAVAGRTPVEAAGGGNGHRPANGVSRRGIPPTPPVRGLAETLAADLPGLPLALREDFVAEHIERLLLDTRSGHRVDGVRAGTFWVHRDRTCSLRYDVRIVDPYGRVRQQTVLGRVHGDGEAAATYLDDRVRPVAARARDSVKGGPWHDWAAVAPEAGLVMHPLPVDPDLPSLVGASDPSVMAGVLGRLAARTGRARVFGRPGVALLHHPRFGPGVLRYDLHPGAAAVSDADDLPVDGKVYPPGEGAAAAAKAQALHAASQGTGSRGLLALPRPLGWLPELDLLLTESIPSTDVLSGLLAAGLQSGAANASGLAGSDLSESVAEAGRLLAALHRTSPPPDLPVRTLADETMALRHEHAIVADIWPDPAEQIWAGVSGQLDAATATPVGPLVLCHGDFTPGRLLTGPEGMAVVDLDTACLGEPALDLGRFLAALDAIGLKVAGDASRPMLGRLTSTFLLAYAMASRPAVHLDVAMRARVAAVRAASHARTAMHACRQLNEHQVRSDLALLNRSRELSRRGLI